MLYFVYNMSVIVYNQYILLEKNKRQIYMTICVKIPDEKRRVQTKTSNEVYIFHGPCKFCSTL